MNTSVVIVFMNISSKLYYVKNVSHSQITIPTASQLDSSTIRQLQQLQQFLIRQTGTESSNAGGGGGPSVAGTSSGGNQDSVKFNKTLLDYDYGDDEDDDNKQQSPRASQNNNVEVIPLSFFFCNIFFFQLGFIIVFNLKYL